MPSCQQKLKRKTFKILDGTQCASGFLPNGQVWPQLRHETGQAQWETEGIGLTRTTCDVRCWVIGSGARRYNKTSWTSDICENSNALHWAGRAQNVSRKVFFLYLRMCLPFRFSSTEAFGHSWMECFCRDIDKEKEKNRDVNKVLVCVCVCVRCMINNPNVQSFRSSGKWARH